MFSVLYTFVAMQQMEREASDPMIRQSECKDYSDLVNERIVLDYSQCTGRITFKNCKWDGGGMSYLVICGTGLSKVVIEGCQVSNIESWEKSPLSLDQSVFDILKCTFTNTKYARSGAAITISNCWGSRIEDCLFDRCDTMGGDSTGIIDINDQCDVRRCKFIGLGDTRMLVRYFIAYQEIGDKTVTNFIEDCVFFSGKICGLLEMDGVHTTYIMRNCSATDITATVGFYSSEFWPTGWILRTSPESSFKAFSSSENITIEHCSFAALRGGSNESVSGIVLENALARVRVIDSSFTNCFNGMEPDDKKTGLIGTGGAMSIFLAKTAVVSGCRFYANYGCARGGAIYAQTEFILRDCIFDGNWLLKPESRNLTETDYFGNHICFHMASSFQATQYLRNCSFIGSSLNCQCGGAVHLYRTEGTGTQLKRLFVFEKCSFKDCYANLSGGAIASGIPKSTSSNNECDFDMWMCTFTNCSAQRGGAISMEDDYAMKGQGCNATECIFTDCRSSLGGGCIAMSANGVVEFLVNGSKFYDSTSGTEGGSLLIELTGGGICTVISCVFSKSGSITSGGAIQIGTPTKKILGTISIEKTEFDSCSSQNGGAVCVTGGNDQENLGAVLVKGSSFHGCRATNNGGAIASARSTISLVSCSFESGEGRYGQAIHLRMYADSLIESCSFRIATRKDESAILVTGHAPNTVLTIHGGCFQKEGPTTSNLAILADSTVSSTVRFTGAPCFDSLIMNSIQIPGKIEGLNMLFFDCHDCSRELPDVESSGSVIAGSVIGIILVVAMIVIGAFILYSKHRASSAHALMTVTDDKALYG